MVIIEEREKRASLNGKIKGLGSYGSYGRASGYPGQRNKRRQKVSTRLHACQLEKVREEVPNNLEQEGLKAQEPLLGFQLTDVLMCVTRTDRNGIAIQKHVTNNRMCINVSISSSNTYKDISKKSTARAHGISSPLFSG